jgi:DNA-binding MarR family transcriptional regulator
MSHILHAALIIYPSLRGSAGTHVDRDSLISQTLDELISHGPFRMMRSMRHWPAGPLSLVHLHVLMLLAEDGPLPMRGLADTLDVSQASVTGIVDRMEQRGLVERHRDDEDRRVVRVALTDAGRKLIIGLGTERRGHLTAMLDELTDEELAGLLRGSRALRRVRQRMQARLEHQGPLAGTPRCASRANHEAAR